MKTYRDYAEYVDGKFLEGYRVCDVSMGVNPEESGMLIEMEREITGGVIGVDVLYDPSEEGKDTPFMISDEYIKHVFDKQE
jgi:hypothetical protein